jgi:ParB family chromosome partitioning protein
MAEKRPALGRGLSALIPEARPSAPAPAAQQARAPETGKPRELDIDLIVPNPRQPRTYIEEHRLEELAQSIRSHGVIQPILVRQVDGRFEIVAGERRWRAAQRAGLLKVPVIEREVKDEDLLQVALIENIQREDLNAIEEAQAYKRLTEEEGLSHEQVAAAVGKDRTTVSNYMRLLKLPVEVRNDLASAALSMGHARALLALTDEAAQRRLAREIVAKGLSVRETEQLARKEAAPSATPPTPAATRVDPNTRAAEEQLRIALGTRVTIVRKGAGGRLQIDFTSEDELQRLYEMLIA